MFPNFSGTAGPIWLNSFCLLRLGHGVVLGQKKIPDPVSGFFRKSGKTQILGYYLTNLAEKPLHV